MDYSYEMLPDQDYNIKEMESPQTSAVWEEETDCICDVAILFKL